MVSNQVIEHLADTDVFVAEIARVLEPGGYAVISTENLASWHNVFALVFGWQPFSLTNVSATCMGLGNPLAVHRAEEWQYHASWQHRRVFAYAVSSSFLRRTDLRSKLLGAPGTIRFPAGSHGSTRDTPLSSP